jgi:hypothetical protein
MAAMLFSGSVPRKIPQTNTIKVAKMSTTLHSRFFFMETATA